MKTIKYLFQYLLIKLLFIIFRLIGYQRASNLGEFIGKKFGHLFRKKQTILNNLICRFRIPIKILHLLSTIGIRFRRIRCHRQHAIELTVMTK